MWLHHRYAAHAALLKEAHDLPTEQAHAHFFRLGIAIPALSLVVCLYHGLEVVGQLGQSKFKIGLQESEMSWHLHSNEFFRLQNLFFDYGGLLLVYDQRWIQKLNYF